MKHDREHILTGNLRPTIFRLAIPVLLEQLLVFGVGFFDTYLSGHLGDDHANATTAVGIAAYMGWLSSLLFGLVGVGTMALVSRHWGAGERRAANRMLNRSLVLAAIAGFIVASGMYVSAESFAGWLNLHDEARDVVVAYLRIDAYGHVFWALSLVGAAALRGAGDMVSPMLVLGLVNVLNMGLSYNLVHGIGGIPWLGLDAPLIAPLGVDGIVIGTVIARVVGGLLMLTVLGHGLSGLKLRWHELRMDRVSSRRILRIGVPAGIDGGIMWFGHFLFLTVIAKLDNGTGQSFNMAAHTIGIQVEAITFLPAIAFGYAASTVIGQSLGAQNTTRAFHSGNEGVLQCSLLAIVISLVFFSQSDWIYAFMSDQSSVRSIGAPALRILAFVQVPLVIGIVYVTSLRGAGDTRFPMLITITSVLGVRVPLAYLFGIVWDGGLTGAWIGMCSDVVLRAILLSIRYARGRWLEIEV
ncbi:MAG: MATE family efflux transporter [Planctomycetota bacterium]|nr:MATE family efflux transporter [Planctomycetota bacterium]